MADVRISAFIDELFAPTPVGPRRNPRTGGDLEPDPPLQPHLPALLFHFRRQPVQGRVVDGEVFGGDGRPEGLPRAGADPSSGGELLRPDIFDIARCQGHAGFYTALSSNGTLIGPENIDAIDAIGFDYVGISLDGIDATHDRFRRKQAPLPPRSRHMRRPGPRAPGRRAPHLTQDNAHDLPALLRLVADEAIDPSISRTSTTPGRQHQPQDRRPPPHPRRADGPAVRHLDRARSVRRDFTTGNRMRTGFTSIGWAQLPREGRSRIRQSCASGAGNASAERGEHRQPGNVPRHHVVAHR